jgi:ABC exporter DevB family membrane fusion protein
MGITALLSLVYALVPKTDTPRAVQAPAVIPAFVVAEGKVETLPGREIQIGAELPGRIEAVLVKEGDSVEKGAIIVRLENRDILARLNEAEADRMVAKAKLDEVLSGFRPEEIDESAAAHRAAIAEMNLARSNFERYEKLVNDGVVPRASFEERQREYEVARNKVQQAAERNALLQKGPTRETVILHETTVQRAEAAKLSLERLLEKTIVRAPISGKVIRKYVNDGEIVYTENPFPLLTIADTEQTRISAEVDESDIGRIHVGDAVEIRSDAYPDVIMNGEIQEIADYVGARQILPNNAAKNLDMKVVQVRINLPPDSLLKLGMTVDVRIKPDGP